MYLGKVVEIGPVDAIYRDAARIPIRAALLASMPSMDPDQRTQEAPLAGDPPNPINPPSGCRFHTRCAFAEAGLRRGGAAAVRRAPACHQRRGLPSWSIPAPATAGAPRPAAGRRSATSRPHRRDRRISRSSSSAATRRVSAVNGGQLRRSRAGEVLACSANPARARASPCARCCGCIPPTRRHQRARSAWRARRARAWRKPSWPTCAARSVAMIFQEPMTGAGPGLHDRPADRRDDRAATRTSSAAGRGARAGAVRDGADPVAAAAARRVSARNVRRHAAARDDRAGAVLPAQACCWPTNPRRRSTRRCKSRSCCCCGSCSANSAWRSIFVTHDIGVASEIADRIAVMYAGRIVEIGSVRDVHPRRRASLHARACWHHRVASACTASRLRRSPARRRDLADLPPGCAFAPRCTLAIAGCMASRPDLASVGLGHDAACFRSDALV